MIKGCILCILCAIVLIAFLKYEGFDNEKKYEKKEPTFRLG